MSHFYQLKPVCQTCTRRIGQYRNIYLELIKKKSVREIFDDFKFDICCRRSFMSGSEKFHDTERREVVDGEYPPGDGPSYLSRDKSTVLKLKKINKELSSKSVVPLLWDDREIEVVKEKKLLKGNIFLDSNNDKPTKNNDLLSFFDTLPEIKKVNTEEEEEEDEGEIVYDDIEIKNDQTVISDHIIPTIPGFPTVYKPDRILKDDTMREITVGYIEKGGERIEMKTKVLNKIFYLAE